MKISFQICNIANPNSFKNSVVFSIFEAPDTYTNLKIALEPFKHQINQLCGKLLWRYCTLYNIHIIMYMYTYTLYITHVPHCDK